MSHMLQHGFLLAFALCCLRVSYSSSFPSSASTSWLNTTRPLCSSVHEADNSNVGSYSEPLRTIPPLLCSVLQRQSETSGHVALFAVIPSDFLTFSNVCCNLPLLGIHPQSRTSRTLGSKRPKADIDRQKVALHQLRESLAMQANSQCRGTRSR